MDSSLAPFVEVRVVDCSSYAWPPGHRVQQATTCSRLWLVKSGSAQVTALGREWPVREGDLFLITPAHRRELVVNDEPFHRLGLGLSVTLFGQFDVLQGIEEPVLWRPEPLEFSRIQEWMETIYELSNNNDPELGGILPAFSCHGLGSAIWGLCWKYLQSEDKLRIPSPQAGWLTAALEHLRHKPSTSVARWSRAVGFSPSQFRRVFAQHTGATPHEYLTRHRLEEARRLLHLTNLPISAIADQLGFKSPSHLSRLFKVAYLMTPSQFRTHYTQLDKEAL